MTKILRFNYEGQDVYIETNVIHAINYLAGEIEIVLNAAADSITNLNGQFYQSKAIMHDNYYVEAQIFDIARLRYDLNNENIQSVNLSDYIQEAEWKK